MPADAPYFKSGLSKEKLLLIVDSTINFPSVPLWDSNEELKIDPLFCGMQEVSNILVCLRHLFPTSRASRPASKACTFQRWL